MPLWQTQRWARWTPPCRYTNVSLHPKSPMLWLWTAEALSPWWFLWIPPHLCTLSIIICLCLLARKPHHCLPVDQDSPSVPSITASSVGTDGVADKPPMKKMMSIGTNHLKREETRGRLLFQKSYNLIMAMQTGPSPSPEGKPLNTTGLFGLVEI